MNVPLPGNEISQQARLSAGARTAAFQVKQKEVQPEPRERFVSSDMAQMLEDIERNYPGTLQPPAADESKPAQAPPRREPISAEFAEMLANIERAEQQALVGETKDSGPPPAAPDNAPVILVVLEEPPRQAHGPEKKGEAAEQGLVGCHLGIECGELVFSDVVHAAQYVATGTGGHGPAAEAATHAAEGDLTPALGKVVSHANKEIGHAAGGGDHGASDALGHTAEASGLMTGAVVAGVVGSVAVGAALTVLGTRQLKQGIEEKNPEAIMEGSGAIIVGARSGLTAASLADIVTNSPAIDALASVAHVALAPLGVAHGALDVAMGAKDIYDGAIKPLTNGGEVHKHETIKGSLGVGLGVSLIATALGGGLPALGVALVFLGGKIGHRIYVSRHANGTPPAEAPRPEAPTPQTAAAAPEPETRP
ncbi:MAG: hypothetical protein HY319_03315 [Armatimonadetes bacterium]|nr:hypothetical protein [Armatimonadota bacterium]